MNGIWIRSEDGAMLMLAQELLVASDDEITWWLYVGKHQVGVYKTHQQAIRQLDDIQKWMAAESCMPPIYDLRERSVKEGDQ